MAAGRHNLTRRQVLGAAAGVPLAAGDMDSLRVPVPASGTSAGAGGETIRGHGRVHVPWTRALAGFRRAESRLAAFRAWEASLPAAARRFPASEPLEQRSGELESARLAAVRRLLRAPAPDLPALALKVALAIDEEIAFFSGGEACLAAVKADALRLCGGDASANASA